MGRTTGIEWCDATWNPWYGCSKVSEGCRNCYAEREMRRYGKDFEVVTRAKRATFMAPYLWGEGKRIFVCSWGDFFHPAADEWRGEAWELMRKNPRHTWLILTKRPELARERLPEDWGQWGLWKNVWIGTSLENGSAVCAKRLNDLMEISAAHKFLSCEPLLGPVDLAEMVEPSEWAWDWVNADPDPFNREPDKFVSLDEDMDWNDGGDIRLNPEWTEWRDERRTLAGMKTLEGMVDWVIAGGESGPKARKLTPNRVRWLRDQAGRLKIPIYFKGWGEWLPRENTPEIRISLAQVVTPDDGLSWLKVGKRKAGRVLDGKEWTQTPWDGKAEVRK